MKLINVPDTCPICGKPTEIKENNGVKILYCTNPNCEAKLINKLNYFCGKNGLDIKGLSMATLKKLIDWGWVNSIVDIMTLYQYKDEWIQKSGFGVKSVEKILDNIEKSKNITLEKFISSLGIPLIGNNVSKELVKHIDSFEDFRNKIKNKFDFSVIDGFAESKVNSLLNYNYSDADCVYSYLNIKNSNEKNDDNLTGINIVITGKLNTYKNRNELQKEIERRGGKVVSSISSKTDYLINNDNTSTSAKNLSAKKLNIPIITEDAFIESFLK